MKNEKRKHTDFNLPRLRSFVVNRAFRVDQPFGRQLRIHGMGRRRIPRLAHSAARNSDNSLRDNRWLSRNGRRIFRVAKNRRQPQPPHSDLLEETGDPRRRRPGVQPNPLPRARNAPAGAGKKRKRDSRLPQSAPAQNRRAINNPRTGNVASLQHIRENPSADNRATPNVPNPDNSDPRPEHHSDNDRSIDNRKPFL